MLCPVQRLQEIILYGNYMLFCFDCRCVVLIDLDCFYAQVEQVRLGIPKDEPLAVISPS